MEKSRRCSEGFFWRLFKPSRWKDNLFAGYTIKKRVLTCFPSGDSVPNPESQHGKWVSYWVDFVPPNFTDTTTTWARPHSDVVRMLSFLIKLRDPNHMLIPGGKAQKNKVFMVMIHIVHVEACAVGISCYRVFHWSDLPCLIKSRSMLIQNILTETYGNLW